MAKRYGIFPIIGEAGTAEDPYRSAIADLDVANHASVIEVDGGTGEPAWNFALTHFATLDLTAVSQISNSLVFPDYPLDGQLSGIDSAVLSALKQSAEAFDLDGEGQHLSVDISDLSASYRSLLISIYQQFGPNLTAADFDRFDVTEPSQ